MSESRANDDLADDLEPTGDEELVAYLDGQLPAEDCERIESRLASDESTRLRVQELDGVWDALDALPRSTTSASFTETTIEMAAIGASTPSRRPRRKPPRIGLAIAVGGLACGVLAGMVVAGAPERRALQTLPTALHAGALENAGSVEFLVGLVDRWPEALGSRLAEEGRDEAGVWRALASADRSERREWLESLPPGRVDEVARRVDAFRDASPARREALKRLDREIAEHPRSDELRFAALAYDALIATLPPGEHARLRGLNAERRMAELEKKAKAWAARLALQLDEAERDALNAAIDGLAKDQRFAELRSRAPGEPSVRQFFWGTTRMVASGRLPKGPPPPRGRGEGPPDRGDPLRRRIDRFLRGAASVSAAWPDWASELEAALPDDARERVASAKTPEVRARRWLKLLGSAAPEDLTDAFAGLPNDQMERALLLPRDELIEKLNVPQDVRGGRGRDGLPPAPSRSRWFGPPGPPPHEGPPPPGPPRERP